MPGARSVSAASCLVTRQMALRAIMDGRGVDAVVLSSPRSLAHYGGLRPEDGVRCLLVVTARAAVLVERAKAPDIWASAALLLPTGCALGCEDEAADGEGLSTLKRLVQARRTLSISADLARQIACG